MMVHFGRSLRVLGTLAVAALVGCSGGGTPSTPVVAASAPAATSNAVGHVTVTFKFPNGTAAPTSDKRSPLYLSYATQSIAITLTPNGGTPITTAIDTSSNAASCTQTSGQTELTCTTGLYAPVGASTLSVTAYDTPQAPGATSNFAGNILGQIANLPVTVVAGTNTPVIATLNGVPATAKVYVAPAQVLAGAAGKAALNVFAYDASGDLIIGTYSTPVTLAETNTAGTYSLSATSIANSGATPTLNYDGTISSANVTATVGAATSAAAVFSVVATATHEYLYQGSTFFYSYFLDLAATTPVAGGTGSQLQTTFLFQFANAGASFNVGPKNEIVDIGDNSTTLGGTNGIEFFPPPSAANHPNLPLTFISYQGPTGSGAPLLTAIAPDQTIVAEYPTSATGATTPTFEMAAYPEGTTGTVPPTDVFGLSDGYSYVSNFRAVNVSQMKYDPTGNLWIYGTSGLDEYAAATVAGALKGGGTISPITKITFATATNPGDFTFDTAGNIYILENPNSTTTKIVVLPASSRGQTVPDTNVVESFAPASGAQELAIEPSTQYLIAGQETNGVNNSEVVLSFFPSVGQQGAPAIGATAVQPFKTIATNATVNNGTLAFVK